MELYAFNAIDTTNGRLVGVLLDYHRGMYQNIASQLSCEHPNKRDFVYVPFLPVWVKELWRVWHPWQCLHTEGRFNLGPFEMPVQRIDPNKRIWLSVPELRKVYDPFLLAHWLWGCDVFDPRDVMSQHVSRFKAQIRSRHGQFRWENEAARIRSFVVQRNRDPIIVCTDFRLYNNREIMVEEGNHRFAAAIVRGDPAIEAIPVGDMSIIRKYEAK